MRHLFGCTVLASLLTCTGCVLFAPPDTLKSPPQGDFVKTLPPVMPEQVTAENCAAMMQALWDETDRDYQRLIVNPPRE